jgi:diguanylate cyclase (GGDEF)-like protein
MGEWEDEQTVVGDASLLKHVRAPGRDRAYVIVIAGPNVGEMFKIDATQDIGRGREAGVSLTDTEISRLHARLVVEGGQIFVQDLESTNGTFVNGEPVRRQLLADGDKIQVGTTTILKFSYHDELDSEFQRKMYDAALRDGLTGAYNKKYFSERLDAEVAYSVRHRSALSLVLFDLDHFKNVNDNYGHLAGDYVLSTMAAGILQSVRREDVFARYGGEEFAVLSRGVDQAGAELFAERLRAWVESYPFVYEDQRLPVTISLGVAAMPECDVTEPTLLVSAADQALYKSKETGRNKVTVSV